MTIILWSSFSSPVHRLPQPWRHPHLRLLPPPLPQVSHKILEHFNETRRNPEVLSEKHILRMFCLFQGTPQGTAAEA